MLRIALFALAVALPGAPDHTVASRPASAILGLIPALDPWAQQFDLPSRITGRTYRIYVARPSGTPPQAGWPIVYVLDADIAFPTVASQNMLRSFAGEPQAIIVGVGYPDAASTINLRNRDFTPSPPNAVGRRIGLLTAAKAEDYGGGEGFRRFLMEELRPKIESALRVDSADQTLMGYSYGGLFTLGVMFDHPKAFHTYVISSPSIWWNGGEILNREAGFSESVRTGRAAPRILVTSDSLEQDVTAMKLPADVDARVATVAAIREERMVDNARELANRLTALPGGTGYRVRYVVFAGETHLTGIPAASSRGLAFALEP